MRRIRDEIAGRVRDLAYELGWWTATDMVGGYEGWKAAALPTRAVGAADETANGELPGIGAPARSQAEVQATVEDLRTKGGV